MKKKIDIDNINKRIKKRMKSAKDEGMMI